ncbi:MAG: HAMP domain-containing histidine kinase [Oscillospiraceae bacterium]|jgi:signal transduction histidine kinase|nr:HAMP domain-containing histidine kinase [Oscillospiraceae bacterium]
MYSYLRIYLTTLQKQDNINIKYVSGKKEEKNMISKSLESALNLVSLNVHNPMVLVNTKFEIFWLNRSYENIFGQEVGATVSVFCENSIKFEEIKWGEPFILECGVPVTGIRYEVRVHAVIDENITYYMLEFVMSSEVAKIVENSDMEDILSTFSFQFRFPISRIANVTEFLGEKLKNMEEPEKTEACKQLDAIDGNCRHLLRSFMNFLDVVKYSAGIHELELGIVEINDFVSALVNECSELVQLKGLTIVFKPSPRRIFAGLDSNKITLALVNVIVNSCTYTREGNRIEVSVAANDGKGSFCISIKDFGIGMSKKVLERATIAYYSGNSGNRHYSQGLGLTLVKYIVALHNGQLLIDSEENEGTLVKIELPFNTSGNDPLILRSPNSDRTGDKYSIVNVQFS